MIPKPLVDEQSSAMAAAPTNFLGFARTEIIGTQTGDDRSQRHRLDFVL